ncbi:hypothetical protein [Empedobacter falsenii]|jgi:hypothetical protein
MKILLIIIPIFSFGQISPELKVFVDSLSIVDRYESSNIGYGGTNSKVYDLFFEASKIATDKEVEYLAINGKTIVKAYFSTEAVDRKLQSVNDIFKYQLENNEEFDRIYGCLGGKEDLVSKMYSSVVNYTLNSTLLELYGEETTWTEKEAFKKLREFNNVIKNSEYSTDKLLSYIIIYDKKNLKKNCKNILPMIKNKESKEIQYVLDICNK